MMKKINELFIQELNNSFVLWPIFLGIGIGIFFALPFDPSIYTAFTVLAVSSIILLLVRNIEIYRNLFIFMFLIALGFTCSAIRVMIVDAPKINQSMEDVFLEGTVKTITIQDKSSKRILLEDLEIEDMADVPKYVRLSTKTNIDGIEVGDRVFARVNLMPIPQSSMVDGFNFALYSYFKEIGGIAISISKIDVLRKGYKTSLMNYINKVRYTIAERIAHVMDITPASLASALIIGDTSKIPENDFNAIRVSGIAHLMAISGLHIVTVVTITFFFLRFVLSKINYLALRYDLKKIAAVGSIILSFGYLLISGMPISAQRAFLMSFLVLFAILLDRNHEAMRGVGIAALIILILTPENLFSPSLQMSFAACIGLIASFKWFTKALSFLTTYHRFGKYIMYVVSVIFCTLVAGFATTPFVIYHFNQFSTYSVLTNLVAIPLADFAIMPLSALSVLLMPLHLEYLPLKLLGYVLEFLMWCAHIVAKMPDAFIYLPSFTDAGIIIITFGMLFLSVLRTRLALSGIPLILVGMMLYKTDGVPDIMIDQDAKLVAINIDGQYYFSSMQSARFARKSWQQAYGMQDVSTFKALGEDICENHICSLSLKNLSTTIMLPKSSADNTCTRSDIIIDIRTNSPKCMGNLLSLSASDLKERGAHEIWINDESLHVKTVAEYIKKRIWNRND